MNLDLHSHRTQLVLTALAASAVTAGLFSAYSQHSRRQKRKSLNDEVLRALAASDEKGKALSGTARPATPSASGSAVLVETPPGDRLAPQLGYAYSEELIREQLARNYAFFGEEAMAKLRQGTVVIVGCGGVGSWAAVMLARSGVTNIRLVDFDYVTLSSLNRHATALLSDVGTPKVACIERTLKQFSRWVRVEAHVDIWRKEQGDRLLDGADWVIDAIDNITTKVDLLKYCHDHDIKVFSSMGAGAKCDPTRVQISDISYTMYDPLARSVRRRLRLLGVSSGIPVVYSTEVPGDVKLLPISEEEFDRGNVKELSAFDDFRVRILPVLGPLPSIFGLHIATYILCELAGKPILNPLAVRGRKKLYERLYRDLLHREEKLTGTTINKLPIDEDDVGLIFEDLYRGRSVVPPHAVPARPALARWDPARPLTLENCVVFEWAEVQRHERECYHGFADSPALRPEEVWGVEVAQVVYRRADEIRKERESIM